MHRRFYGAMIAGIGIARKGLRRVRNIELAEMLRSTEGQFISWIQGGSVESWWTSLPHEEQSGLEKEFAKQNGRPIAISCPADQFLLWKTVLRERQIETGHKWIVDRTGIQERQFADANVATSDLACDAAIEALHVAQVDPSEVDGIFLGTVSPDHNQTPPTTAIIAEKLGLGKGLGVRNIVFRDVSEACTSSLAAFDTAYSHIQTGRCKTALLIGADKMHTTVSHYSRNLFPILGDGAGALVLRQTHLDSDTFGPRAFFSNLDGSLASLIVTPAGGSRMLTTASMITNPLDQSQFMFMDGRRVRKEAVRLLLPPNFENWRNAVIPVALAEAGLPMETEEDFAKALNTQAYIIFHQANGRMCDDLAKKLKKFGFRGSCPSNIARYANTTSASWILLLYELWRKGKLKSLTRRHKRLFVVAFGGGLTAFTARFDWTLELPEEYALAI